jgi:hypothetical protein
MFWFHRQKIYSDLSEEIRQHLEEKIDALMAGGMSRQDAESAARREFGNVTLIEESSREPWTWPRAESIFADIKFALRKLRKSPGFALTAMLTLALGIGANVVVFSVLNAVLLRPLAVSDPQNLYQVRHQQWMRGRLLTASYPAFEDFQRRNTTFSEMAGVYGYSHARLSRSFQKYANVFLSCYATFTEACSAC